MNQRCLKMKILDELLDQIKNDAPVRKVLVGIHWVVMCSKTCGMASAMVNKRSHGHTAVKEVGRLHEKSARELAELVHSDNLLEAGIGMAAINSLLEFDQTIAVEINAADVLTERGKDSDVAVVGSFPFTKKLRQRVRNLWVLELHPAEGEYPAEAAGELIPRADVVAISASSLINHTLDDLLKLPHPDATVMILGPTTPLSPVLFEHGVDILCGIRVVNEDDVFRTVAQGATFQQVEGVQLISQVHKTEKG